MQMNSELYNISRYEDMPENGYKTGNLLSETGINRKSSRNTKPLEALLSKYKSHSLDEIKKADLMNRVDTKYLLPLSYLEKLLKLLAPSYSVLEIESSRIFTYRNTYFDTPEFSFYMMHHNGKLNRFKIRHRLYVDSGSLYMELKHKTNKSVTRKDRVLMEDREGSLNRITELASRPFKGSSCQLCKSLICSYVRIALANEEKGERLTLDFDLSFQEPEASKTIKPEQVLIAEVKRKNYKTPSLFMDLMDRYRKKPVSFSKYCIGCSVLYQGRIKTNRFKETLLALGQINQNRSGQFTMGLKRNI